MSERFYIFFGITTRDSQVCYLQNMDGTIIIVLILVLCAMIMTFLSWLAVKCTKNNTSEPNVLFYGQTECLLENDIL